MLEPTTRSIVRAIQNGLTPDLLSRKWRVAGAHPYAGHCYVATEALWYAMGGPKSPYHPQVARQGEITHWWLLGPEGVVDPTAAQFENPFDYTSGRGCGFLTKGISARSSRLLARVLPQAIIQDCPNTGSRVRVYRNLHTGTWSCQDVNSGLVIDHPRRVALTAATFVIRSAGQAKVRATGRKNVHAFVVGTVAESNSARLSFASIAQATYNPYRHDTFVSHKPGDPTVTAPIHQADYVYLDQHNRILVLSGSTIGQDVMKQAEPLT